MEVLRCLFLSLWIVTGYQNTLAFASQQLLHPTRRTHGCCMSLDNFNDDIDVTSSQGEEPDSLSSMPNESSSSTLGSFQTQERAHRNEQIESVQGVWWTSEKKDQLVEIRSSYAIFDVVQKTYVSSTSPMPPAVAYPLGGTKDIVTLRTFKLVTPSSSGSIPEWTPSPTSKVSVQRGGGTAIGTESPSIQTVSPTPTTCLRWIKCESPELSWRSDWVVQGYDENSVATLEASGGPHWSACPVDVLRACMKGVASKDYRSRGSDLVNSLCRFSQLPKTATALGDSEGVNIGRKHRDHEALRSIGDLFERCSGSTPQWSIIKCHYVSPDGCTLSIEITSTKNSDTKKYEFFLSRKTKKFDRASDDDANGLPISASRISSKDKKTLVPNFFNSVMDVELLVRGKT